MILNKSESFAKTFCKLVLHFKTTLITKIISRLAISFFIFQMSGSLYPDVEPLPNPKEDKHPFFTWQGFHISDFWYGLHGGLHNRMGYINLTDISFSFDFDKVWSQKGFTALLEVEHTVSERPVLLVQSIQGFDNIEDPRVSTMAFLYQLWIQKQLGERLKILAGFYDVESEFYYTDSAQILILPTWGTGSEFSLSGRNGPSSFPLVGTALRMKYTTPDNLYAQAAIFDAAAANPLDRIYAYSPFSSGDGILLLTEIGHTFEMNNNKAATGKFALGAWEYLKRVPTFINPIIQVAPDLSHNSGLYAIVDYPLFINPQNKENVVHGFIRYGTSNPIANIFDKALGAGITINGFSDKRPKDIIAFGIGPAWTSPESRLENPELPVGEYQFELTYAASIKPWLTVQPDIIYITFPKGDPTVYRNAFLMGLRIRVDLDQFYSETTVSSRMTS